MLFGTDEQKQRWLEPAAGGRDPVRLRDDRAGRRVAPTPRNIQTSIVRDGDDYVINGRKWWISGAADERCQIFIVMGKTDPDGAPHRQQSMVLVPRDTPGLEIIRHLPVFGYQDQHGHSELRVHRRPGAGDQPPRRRGRRLHDRPGPPRPRPHPPLHARHRHGRAGPGADGRAGQVARRVRPPAGRAGHGARGRSPSPGSRSTRPGCYVLKTADLIDKYGAKGARTEISAIKVAAPTVALDVIDRAIQVHGGAGVSDDTPLAQLLRAAPARCGSSTAPTRCTSAAWPRRSWRGSAPTRGWDAPSGAIVPPSPPAASFAMSWVRSSPSAVQLARRRGRCRSRRAARLDLVRGVVLALGAQQAHQLLPVQLHRFLRPRRDLVGECRRSGASYGGSARHPATCERRQARAPGGAGSRRCRPGRRRGRAGRCRRRSAPAEPVTDDTRSTTATPRTSRPTSRSRRASREPASGRALT